MLWNIFLPQLMLRRDKSICGSSLCCDAKAGLEVTGMFSSFILIYFLAGNGNQMIVAFMGQ